MPRRHVRSLAVAAAIVSTGCARPSPAPPWAPDEQLPPGQSFTWMIRAEHADEILMAVGDSLDVVLLRDRCGVPAGHGQKGCYDASAGVRLAPRWTLDRKSLARVHPLPAGWWRFGAGVAGARVYGRRPGLTRLRAAGGAGEPLADASVRVVSAPGAVRVVLEPKPSVIAAGDTVRFRITARDAAGRIVATLPLPAAWRVVGPPDSLGFAPVAFYPWETGGALVARLGRLTDTLELHFRPHPR